MLQSIKKMANVEEKIRVRKEGFNIMILKAYI